ncbi:MAG: hypothetical protein COY58_09405 [Gammaproteobacteria bacterium CG_4_10_14_0_8_um_filter_38_16]|nr:MAG: hypothetical protein COY58_09405 [Gammaproteobacteria bacterium CG_4_10_14_0_8_um_filter_38_16]PJA03094.1 MAG: hypothetical protein COX72_07260 [Gammaproteobacteria bacterium CG_4_10_14_0_2_um_filter_38_22]PJB10286.1 MAG: hypothetical protein CO120_05645 [Gammaproteobacteria bacterium CG_4_9_14_3_um_filter_38_9]
MRFAQPPKNLNDIAALEKIPLDQRLIFNTTYDVIRYAAKTWGRKPAIHFLPTGDAIEAPITFSYQDLLNRVNQAANLFASLQASNGDVVSILLPNLPQTHFALWGAQAVGIANPLRPDLSPEQIATLLRKTNSKTLVTVGEFIPGPMWQNVLKARELYPELKTILVIGGRPNQANGIDDFDTQMATQSLDFTQRDCSPEAVCAYFHTSATTSPHPKLVRLTQRQQVYVAWAIGTCLGYQENDMVAVGLPFFHVGAPMVGGLVPFMCGATTVMMSPMGWMRQGVVENFWNIVKRYHVTVTAALNFMYSQLLHIPGIEKSTLRLAISGTALSPEESEQYKRFGIQVADIYGSSETVMTTFNPPEHVHFSSMGLRLPYTQLKVVNVDGGECAPNEVGELWIFGPNLTQGYQSGSSKAFTQDGWFKTGDLVYQDAENVFWFFDRTADVICKNARMISSLALEHEFEKHPKVARAAVIGQPDLQYGEVPVLYVTAKPNCALMISELQQWAHDNIDSAIAPVSIIIESVFPLNGIAKVMKPILRERNAVAFYSTILNRLSAETHFVFDVRIQYGHDEKMIANIQIETGSDLQDVFLDKIKQAVKGYFIPAEITLSEPAMSFEM